MDEQKPNNPAPGSNPANPQPAPQFMDVVTPDVPQPQTQATPGTTITPAGSPSPISESPTPIIPPSPEVVAGLVPPQPASEPSIPTSPEPTPRPTPEARPDTPNPHAKHETPVAAIVIAVVVGLALAGLVVFSYLKAKDSSTIKRTDNQTTAESQAASTADVDETNEEIDSSLEQANDDTDFATGDLSDATLGL